jgi:uncharacterized SAM-binding protein YcdF (DUF218 family)
LSGASPLARAAPPQPRRRRFFRWAAAILALLLVAAYLARYPLLTGVANFLDVSEEARPVDYVMILGGHAQTRPFKAAALYKAGMAHHVLIAKQQLGPDALAGLMEPEEEIDRRILIALGVPKQAITFLDGPCTSTWDEAKSLEQFLDGKPAATVTIVTNPYHTRRTRWVFRKVLGNLASALHVVGAPLDDFDAHNWWKKESGFKAYTSEYLKFPIYILRY